MNPRPTVTVLESVIAGFHDLYQPAGRPAIGVVANSKDATDRIDTDAKRIPEPGGNATQIVAVGITSKDSTFAGSGLFDSVLADHSIRNTQVFAHPKIQVVFGIECQTAQAVVWIISFRVQVDQCLFVVSHVVIVRIANSKNPGTCRHVNPVVRATADTHRMFGALIESTKAVRLSVTVGVFDDADSV